jgi:predicted nucleic acid-binding protein
LAGRADALVSGDDDLLTLKVFRGIPIITVAEWLRWR